MYTFSFPIRDQRLWRILSETFLLKWAWLEHWIVSRLNGKDPTLWWEVKKDFSFLATDSTWPLLNYKVLLVHVCWWRKLYHVSTFSLYWFILVTKYNKLNALILVLLNKEVLFASFVQHFFMVFLHWANKNTFVKKWSEFIEIYKKILLFTFSSIKSTNASGAEEMPETKNLNQT